MQLAIACLLAAGCRPAESPAPRLRVRIEQDKWSELDFAQVKTGEWVEYEVEDGPEDDASRWRVALVEETQLDWWIEATGGDGIPAGWTALAQISKGSSQVTRCWLGKPGVETREVPVLSASRRLPERGQQDERYGRGPGLRDVVSREPVDLGGHTFDCAKLVQCAAGEEHGPSPPPTDGNNPEVGKMRDLFLGMEDSDTLWWSQEVPAFLPPPRGQVLDSITWDFACKGWRGGLVRRVRKFLGTIRTERLVSFGKNARRTVPTPGNAGK